MDTFELVQCSEHVRLERKLHTVPVVNVQYPVFFSMLIYVNLWYEEKTYHSDKIRQKTQRNFERVISPT